MRTTTTEIKHPTDTLLDHSWIYTDQANEYLKAISRTDHQLKDFSLLSNPTLPASLVTKYEQFKILLVGETHSGKSSLIRALMGKEFSPTHNRSTLGIQTTSIYWPVRMMQGNKAVSVLRLDFWDVGHVSADRFAYIEKDAMESVDLILFVVSAADRESFNQLPSIIQEKRSQASTTRPFATLVFITQFDQLAVLTENDAREFEATFRIPVYLFSSVYSNMRQATFFLNIIAENLYQRR